MRWASPAEFPYPKETQDDDNVCVFGEAHLGCQRCDDGVWRHSERIQGRYIQLRISAPVDPAAYSVAPEELTSYEVGFKSLLGGGRHRLTGAVFYYDYKDSQAFVYRDLSQLLFNADAEVTGAELEWTGIVTDGLELSAGISLLDTTVKSVQDGTGAIRDREMVLAPEFSMNAMARYTWDMSSGNARRRAN